MSAVDVVVPSLPPDGYQRSEPFAIFTDGDNTMFYPDRAELYPDAEQFLQHTNPAALLVVSANPDVDLAIDRSRTIGADIVIPARPQWVKLGLFTTAINQALKEVEFTKALVLGDRFGMDVALGKQALNWFGIEAYGVLVRRPEAWQNPPTNFDRFLLRPTENSLAKVATLTHTDSFLRPRLHTDGDTAPISAGALPGAA